MIFLKHTLLVFLLALSFTGVAQITGDSTQVQTLNYAKPKEYTIASVSVTCSEFTDKSVVRLLSGLQEGDKIQLPGDKIAEAIKALWKQGLFEDVKIYLVKTIGKEVFLNIAVIEKPRLTKFGFSNNVKKNDADEIRGKLRLVPGKVITDFTIGYIKNIARDFYVNKGFYHTKVEITKTEDTKARTPHVILNINVIKGKRVRISNLNIYGNTINKT